MYVTFNTAYPAYVVFCHFMPKWVAQHVIFSNTQNLSNAGPPCILKKAVVYQRPKLSAENESFHYSAFGFGRRI